MTDAFARRVRCLQPQLLQKNFDRHRLEKAMIEESANRGVLQPLGAARDGHQNTGCLAGVCADAGRRAFSIQPRHFEIQDNSRWSMT